MATVGLLIPVSLQISPFAWPSNLFIMANQIEAGCCGYEVSVFRLRLEKFGPTQKELTLS